MGGIVLLAVVLVYTLVAAELAQWWITGPMVFVAAGAILTRIGVPGHPRHNPL